MSSSFSFLEDQEPDLYQLARIAEDLVHRSPTTCLRELRTFGEVLTKRFMQFENLAVEGMTQHDRLVKLQEAGIMPEPIVTCMHQIRMRGNDASHNNEGSDQRAQRQLRNAWTAARWVHERLYPQASRPSSFQLPNPKEERSHEAVREELELLRDRLAKVEDERTEARSSTSVAHLENHIKELEQKIQQRSTASTARSTPKPSSAPRGPSIGTRIGASLRSVSSRLGRALQAIRQTVQSIVGAVWRGISKTVRMVVRAVRRVVRWAVILALVGATFFYFPTLYRTGMGWLPQEARKGLPAPTVVEETHRTVLPIQTRATIVESVARGWEILRTEGKELAGDAKAVLVDQWKAWQSEKSASETR
ncbi:DUF4145 domain-containing protein [Salisaeta longa]|uniref:DUF4145 domain-containing protein n=1 Tax=Salisaeta longa TaxID=503170 RepID=UPI0012FBEDAB|nr:DUF4145 domain-containing protein [Salisaeta longa]